LPRIGGGRAVSGIAVSRSRAVSAGKSGKVLSLAVSCAAGGPYGPGLRRNSPPSWKKFPQLTNATNQSPQAIAADQAAEWLARLHENGAGAEIEQQFMTWLQASPLHVEAYLVVAMATSESPAAQWSLSQARALPVAEALSALTTESLPHALPQSPVWGAGRLRRWSVGGVAAICAIAAALWLRPVQAPLEPVGQRLMTHHGESRYSTLADGSIVQLQTETSLQLRYTAAERLIKLESGRAFFKVAKGDHRRFRVVADGASVVATGTEFDVNLEDQHGVVTLVEGHVVVYADATASVEPVNSDMAAARSLRAGQQVEIRQGWVSPPADVDLRVLEAWRTGEVIADRMPLVDVVREFNRYGVQPLRIADRRLADMQISGVFNARDPNTLISFLRATEQVQVLRGADGLTLQRSVETRGYRTDESPR